MSKAENFIRNHTSNCSNVVACSGMIEGGGLRYHKWLTPNQARKAVEIEREEIAERACDYLNGLIELLNEKGHGLKKERIIGGLKQAMKNE